MTNVTSYWFDGIFLPPTRQVDPPAFHHMSSHRSCMVSIPMGTCAVTAVEAKRYHGRRHGPWSRWGSLSCRPWLITRWRAPQVMSQEIQWRGFNIMQSASTLGPASRQHILAKPTLPHYDDATLVVVTTGTSPVYRHGVSLLCWSMGCFTPEESFRWQSS